MERKVRAYLDLAFSGRYQRALQRRFFRTLIIVDSLKQLSSLSRAIARLSDKVIGLGVLGQLSLEGPLTSIWRRPGASASESLTGS